MALWVTTDTETYVMRVYITFSYQLQYIVYQIIPFRIKLKYINKYIVVLSDLLMMFDK